MNTRRLALYAASATLLACASDRMGAPEALRQQVAPGLEQVVRLNPPELASGQQVTIQSVVINRLRTPVTISSRICGLDTKGDLELTGSMVMCAGYSALNTLAPGDSVSDFDGRIVSSPPGRYLLLVRHLLDPEVWVEVPVVVRAP